MRGAAGPVPDPDPDPDPGRDVRRLARAARASWAISDSAAGAGAATGGESVVPRASGVTMLTVVGVEDPGSKNGDDNVVDDNNAVDC